MNNITVADLTLNDLEPYINGKKFTGEVEVARGDEAIFKKFLNLLEEDDIAKEFFNTYDVAQNFYTTMPDFKQIIPKELQVECFYAAKNGVKLVFLNTSTCDAVAELLKLTDNKGYNDVFVMAPVRPVVETGDQILGADGCRSASHCGCGHRH